MRKYIVLIILVITLVLAGCASKAPLSENSDNKGSNQVKQEEPVDELWDWQVYEKKDKDVRLKYHKDWYYSRDSEAEKELGYDLYVGFAPDKETLGKGRPYPIEFLIVAEDKEAYGAEYAETVVSMNNKNYILTSNNKSEYENIIEKMINSLEVIIN